ncbi:MAG: alpha/beta hydrolase [Myxococcota bacterium]
MNPTRFLAHEGLDLAYTRSGTGPPIILLHGWPFHKASFRKLLPLLDPHHTCYALDAAGMGESSWSRDTDFSFAAHVERIRSFADAMGLQRYSVLGHDTGGTLARMLAVADAGRVEKVVAIDTEVPGHVPSAVPKLQRLLRWRAGRALFRRALGSPRLMRAWLAQLGFFRDPKRLDAEFLRLFASDWRRSEQAFEGFVNYLMAVDPDVIDALEAVHARIAVPMLFVWGAEDPIFPLPLAQELVGRLSPRAALAVVEGTRFLPHEERPAEVAACVLPFLAASA